MDCCVMITGDTSAGCKQKINKVGDVQMTRETVASVVFFSKPIVVLLYYFIQHIFA